MSDCDTSIQIIEDDVSEQFEPINKRRSEIFQRRSLVNYRVNDSDEDADRGSTSDIEESTTKLLEEPFDLAIHIQSLKSEHEQWRKEYKRRKAERKLLEKHEASLGNAVELDLSVLSESEQDFLASKPNYNEICKNIQELKPLAIQIAQLNAEINHRNKTLMERIERKIRIATAHIAKLKQVDIVV